VDVGYQAQSLTAAMAAMGQGCVKTQIIAPKLKYFPPKAIKSN
jgi:hypothetical protein